LVAPLETPCEPGRNARACFHGEARDLLEIMDRHNARHDGAPDTTGARLLNEAQEALVVEKELRDDARGASIDLSFQVVEIILDRWALGMLLRISGDRNQIGRASCRERV